MSRPRAVITGIGVIASNGLTREDFFRSIIHGESGLQSNDFLRKLGANSHVAGEVNRPFKDVQFPEDDERNNQLANISIDEAMSDSGLTKEKLASYGKRAGLSVSTSLSGNLRLMNMIRSEEGRAMISPDWIIDLPSSTTRIAQYTGISGPTYTTTSACAAGTAGAGIALDLIREGVTDIVVVVGMDMLIAISAAGFHSLNSMSPRGCTPFDKNRDGLSLGEGSAAFIVESLESARSRDAHIYGEILGYGLGNDAYHITSPDPDGAGAYSTMLMALQDADLQIQDIDYINAHGTATELNDLMETSAMTRLFGNSTKNSKVMISSTKAVTGHCLGAAGSIELAVTLLAVDRNVAPPTASLEQPMGDYSGLELIRGECVNKEIKYAMSNSFAFSGNSASIIVGKVPR